MEAARKATWNMTLDHTQVRPLQGPDFLTLTATTRCITATKEAQDNEALAFSEMLWQRLISAGASTEVLAPVQPLIMEGARVPTI